jgi:signal transduction histidine kinase
VVRHAGPVAARLGIQYAGDAVVIELEEEGRGLVADRPVSTGNGLVGMRERAASLGGELQAGPRRNGGFRVWARLPIGAKP